MLSRMRKNVAAVAAITKRASEKRSSFQLAQLSPTASDDEEEKPDNNEKKNGEEAPTTIAAAASATEPTAEPTAEPMTTATAAATTPAATAPAAEEKNKENKEEQQEAKAKPGDTAESSTALPPDTTSTNATAATAATTATAAAATGATAATAATTATTATTATEQSPASAATAAAAMSTPEDGAKPAADAVPEDDWPNDGDFAPARTSLRRGRTSSAAPASALASDEDRSKLEPPSTDTGGSAGGGGGGGGGGGNAGLEASPGQAETGDDSDFEAMPVATSMRKKPSTMSALKLGSQQPVGSALKKSATILQDVEEEPASRSRLESSQSLQSAMARQDSRKSAKTLGVRMGLNRQPTRTMQWDSPSTEAPSPDASVAAASPSFDSEATAANTAEPATATTATTATTKTATPAGAPSDAESEDAAAAAATASGRSKGRGKGKGKGSNSNSNSNNSKKDKATKTKTSAKAKEEEARALGSETEGGGAEKEASGKSNSNNNNNNNSNSNNNNSNSNTEPPPSQNSPELDFRSAFFSPRSRERAPDFHIEAGFLLLKQQFSEQWAKVHCILSQSGFKWEGPLDRGSMKLKSGIEAFRFKSFEEAFQESNETDQKDILEVAGGRPYAFAVSAGVTLYLDATREDELARWSRAFRRIAEAATNGALPLPSPRQRAWSEEAFQTENFPENSPRGNSPRGPRMPHGSGPSDPRAPFTWAKVRKVGGINLSSGPSDSAPSIGSAAFGELLQVRENRAKDENGDEWLELSPFESWKRYVEAPKHAYVKFGGASKGLQILEKSHWPRADRAELSGLSWATQACESFRPPTTAQNLCKWQPNPPASKDQQQQQERQQEQQQQQSRQSVSLNRSTSFARKSTSSLARPSVASVPGTQRKSVASTTSNNNNNNNNRTLLPASSATLNFTDAAAAAAQGCRAAIAALVPRGTPPCVVESWLLYHRRIGFSRLYLYFDQFGPPTEGASQPELLQVAQKVADTLAKTGQVIILEEMDSSWWWKARERSKFYKFLPEHWAADVVHLSSLPRGVEARQQIISDLALQDAYSNGMDWFMHIGIQELFYVPEPRHREDVSGYFAGVDPRVEVLRFLNHEAVPEHASVRNCFRELSLFRASNAFLSSSAANNAVVEDSTENNEPPISIGRKSALAGARASVASVRRSVSAGLDSAQKFLKRSSQASAAGAAGERRSVSSVGRASVSSQGGLRKSQSALPRELAPAPLAEITLTTTNPDEGLRVPFSPTIKDSAAAEMLSRTLAPVHAKHWRVLERLGLPYVAVFFVGHDSGRSAVRLKEGRGGVEALVVEADVADSQEQPQPPTESSPSEACRVLPFGPHSFGVVSETGIRRGLQCSLVDTATAPVILSYPNVSADQFIGRYKYLLQEHLDQRQQQQQQQQHQRLKLRRTTSMLTSKVRSPSSLGGDGNESKDKDNKHSNSNSNSSSNHDNSKDNNKDKDKELASQLNLAGAEQQHLKAHVAACTLAGRGLWDELLQFYQIVVQSNTFGELPYLCCHGLLVRAEGAKGVLERAHRAWHQENANVRKSMAAPGMQRPLRSPHAKRKAKDGTWQKKEQALDWEGQKAQSMLETLEEESAPAKLKRPPVFLSKKAGFRSPGQAKAKARSKYGVAARRRTDDDNDSQESEEWQAE